jgi:hypothetical protein
MIGISANFLLVLLLSNLKENKWGVSALLITILADLFLTQGINYDLDNYFGLSFFIVVQIFYNFKIGLKDTNPHLKRNFLITQGIFIIISTIPLFFFEFEMVIFLTIYYLLNFINNIILSIKTKQSKIFIIGLILFVICDIFVGIDGMVYVIDLPPDLVIAINNNKIFMAMLFYIPSQILLTLDNISLKKIKEA